MDDLDPLFDFFGDEAAAGGASMGRGGGSGGGALPDASGHQKQEWRIDPADGQAYTKEEFIEEYGGLEEWENAGRMPSQTNLDAKNLFGDMFPADDPFFKMFGADPFGDQLSAAAAEPAAALAAPPPPKSKSKKDKEGSQNKESKKADKQAKEAKEAKEAAAAREAQEAAAAMAANSLSSGADLDAYDAAAEVLALAQQAAAAGDVDELEDLFDAFPDDVPKKTQKKLRKEAQENAARAQPAPSLLSSSPPPPSSSPPPPPPAETAPPPAAQSQTKAESASRAAGSGVGASAAVSAAIEAAIECGDEEMLQSLLSDSGISKGEQKKMKKRAQKNAKHAKAEGDEGAKAESPELLMTASPEKSSSTAVKAKAKAKLDKVDKSEKPDSIEPKSGAGAATAQPSGLSMQSTQSKATSQQPKPHPVPVPSSQPRATKPSPNTSAPGAPSAAILCCNAPAKDRPLAQAKSFASATSGDPKGLTGKTRPLPVEIPSSSPTHSAQEVGHDAQSSQSVHNTPVSASESPVLTPSVRTAFASIRQSEGGTIPMDELKFVLRKLGLRVDTAAAVQLLASFDSDGATVLDVSEFAELVHALRRLRFTAGRQPQVLPQPVSPSDKHASPGTPSCRAALTSPSFSVSPGFCEPAHLSADQHQGKFEHPPRLLGAAADESFRESSGHAGHIAPPNEQYVQAVGDAHLIAAQYGAALHSFTAPQPAPPQQRFRSSAFQALATSLAFARRSESPLAQAPMQYNPTPTPTHNVHDVNQADAQPAYGIYGTNAAVSPHPHADGLPSLSDLVQTISSTLASCTLPAAQGYRQGRDIGGSIKSPYGSPARRGVAYGAW